MVAYDVIVVGAGIEGSATAYQCARQGCRTLLLEQFTLPHSRGSSHGQTRIIRKAYDKLCYARMMPEAYDMWGELEHESGETLILKTGLLNVMKKTGKVLGDVTKSLDRISSKYEILDSVALRERFPQFTFDDSFTAVMDQDGGVVMAEKALTNIQSLFRKHGGVVRDGEKVTNITSGKENVVSTTKGTYKAKAVVIAAGAWANQVLAPLGCHLPLQSRRIEVMYWSHQGTAVSHQFPQQSGSHTTHIGGYTAREGFPTFHQTEGDLDTDPRAVYGVPDLEFPGLVKICSHSGPDVDPDELHRGESTAHQQVASFIKKHMPGVSSTPSMAESCLYTMTPDHDFIIDKVPGYPKVIVAAGFSGHGFKLAPVVGKLAHQLATAQVPSYDLSQFSIARFNLKSKI